MTTIHKMSAEGIEAVEPNAVSLYTNSPVEYMAFTKGALDVLIDRSSQLWVHRDVVDLDQQWRKKIFAAHDEMAAQGFRILGMGVRSVKNRRRKTNWKIGRKFDLRRYCRHGRSATPRGKGGGRNMSPRWDAHHHDHRRPSADCTLYRSGTGHCEA